MSLDEKIEQDRLFPLTLEIRQFLNRWEPRQDNKICQCAGDIVCVFHEGSALIRKLAYAYGDFAAAQSRAPGELVQEQIAAGVEQSVFYYEGSCPVRLVPSASGEAATQICAAYIRSLILEAPSGDGWRDAVIEECAKVADATAEDYYDKAVKYFRKSHEGLFRAASDAVDEAAAAIRALKSPPPPAHNAGEKAEQTS